MNFELPNGSFKPHPALVISNENVLEAEEIFYALMISTKDYNDEFSFELKDFMLAKPMSKKCFVKCQIIQSYSDNEVISKISTVKIEYFEQIKAMLFKTVF